MAFGLLWSLFVIYEQISWFMIIFLGLWAHFAGYDHNLSFMSTFYDLWSLSLFFEHITSCKWELEVARGINRTKVTQIISNWSLNASHSEAHITSLVLIGKVNNLRELGLWCRENRAAWQGFAGELWSLFVLYEHILSFMITLLGLWAHFGVYDHNTSFMSTFCDLWSLPALYEHSSLSMLL